MRHALVPILLASPAAAQVVELPPAEIVTDAPSETSLHTGVASVVETEADRGKGLVLPDLIEPVPGVYLRRLGGAAGYTTLSIRGSSADNVAIVLDDLPLATSTLGPVDLALIPLESVARVEVYRGAGPVRFQSPLGGVVHLVTRAPSDARLTAELGYGSFNTAHAWLASGGPLAGARYLAFLAYRATDGDFTYYDDRETLYTRDDDRLATRHNNAAHSGTARVKVEASGPQESELAFSVTTLWRSQGVPGPGALSTRRSHTDDAEVHTRASANDLTWWRLRTSLGADFLASLRTFRDPEREVGLRVTGAKSRLAQQGGDARLVFTQSAAHETEVAARLSQHTFSERATGELSRPSLADTLESERLFMFGLEHRADLAPSLRLVPSLRAEQNLTRAAQNSELSPRAGLLWLASPCELRANFGRFHRFPTLLERYGDGAVSVANTTLLPERGLSTDAGGACAGERASVELYGFWNRTTNLIALLQNSQLTLRATNLGRTENWGIETAAQGELSWLSARAAYTYLRAIDESGVVGLDGKRTPGLPAHRLHARLRVGNERLALTYDTSLASRVYLDRANLRPLPSRSLHHLTLALTHRGFALGLSVRNLTNLRAQEVAVPGAQENTGVSKVADFLGYPLPGRSFFASLTWRST